MILDLRVELVKRLGADVSGYTNPEMYLNELVSPRAPMSARQFAPR
jgi:hypothetical protein